MDNNTPITITGEEFDRAVAEVMEKNMKDPRHAGHVEGALVFVLGGTVFAREVKGGPVRGEGGRVQ